jgi:hypothetical protein
MTIFDDLQGEFIVQSVLKGKVRACPVRLFNLNIAGLSEITQTYQL